MDDDRNDHNMTDASNEQLSTGYHGAESPSYDKARIEASALVQNGRSRQTLRGNSGDESEDQTDLNALEEVPSKLSHEPEQHALLEGQGASGGLTSAKRSDNLASLPISALRSGICYDVRMRFHATPADDDHHPEDPRRIHAIYESIDGAGLVGDDTVSSKPAEREKTNLLVRIPAREASKEEICRVHNAEHYDFIEDTANLPLETLRTISDASDSVFFNKSTFFCAKLSAGGAIESCEAVISGRVKNAIAVIRPPGHHAVPHEAQGFCFFNNVCVAAKHCQDRYPDICRKILIFDWDVHHGNGTQAAFYNDPNILLISIHVHENGRFYPEGPYGNHKHCGEGLGRGKNVNIPWTRKGMRDKDYMHAFQTIVMPIASEFDPNLVIVSAGFDAAMGDELGGCFVTPPGYAHMTHGLMSLAKGKIVVCLEGGYNLHSISVSALAVTRTLMGEPPDRVEDGEISAIAGADVKKVKQEQSSHWSCMRDEKVGFGAVTEGAGERMHDVIRLFQSYDLYINFSMFKLTIHREVISKSFQNEVLATSDYATASTLLIIFHDPPEMMGIPDPETQKLDLARTWLADHVKSYISWAAGKGYGVIDVNIPKYLTDLDEEDSVPGEEPRSVAHTRELITYLWSNYIELNASKKLILMGVGNAHYAAVQFLNMCDCEATRAGVVNFIANSTIRSVKKESDESIASWYRSHSLVLVNPSHVAFDEGRPQTKRKFGNVTRAGSDDLSEMLVMHKEEVMEFIEYAVQDVDEKSA